MRPGLRARAVALFARPTAVQRILLSYSLVGVVYCIGKELHGPFLRTLVVCDARPAPGGAFSGSALCGDAHRVLAAAQAQENRLVSAKLAVHGIVAPFIASLADQFGRKALLMLGLGSYAFAYLLFSAIAPVNGVHSFPVLLFSFMLEGATNAFDVVYHAMLADVTPGDKERGVAFYAFNVCNFLSANLGIFVSVCILRLELESYSLVWLSLSGLLLATLLLSQRALSETLTSAPKDLRSLSCSSLLGPLRTVGSDSFLRWWLALSVVTAVGASGIGSLMPSFTISVYGWRAGDLQAYSSPGQAVSFAVMLLTPFATFKIRPVVAVFASAAWSSAWGVVGLLRPFSPMFLLVPCYVSPLAGLLGPANEAFASKLFPLEQQATLRAVGHLINNLGSSVSFYLYSMPWMYQPTWRGPVAVWPFLVAYLSTLVPTLLRLRHFWPLLRAPLVADDGNGEVKEESSARLHEV